MHPRSQLDLGQPLVHLACRQVSAKQHHHGKKYQQAAQRSDDDLAGFGQDQRQQSQRENRPSSALRPHVDLGAVNSQQLHALGQRNGCRQ
jgi:hypothetical protein